MRLAIVDLGSNSIRLLMMEAGDSGYHVVAEAKAVARLGARNADGTLRQEAVEQALMALQGFARICAQERCDTVLPVATAAVRSLADPKPFLDAVYRVTGWKFRILSGEEEAYYDYVAVANATPLHDALIADVGGASTELILMQGRRPTGMISLPVGAVTMTQRFAAGGLASSAALSACLDAVDTVLDTVTWLGKGSDLPVVGVGGTARALGKIERRRTGGLVDVAHMYRLPSETLARLVERLWSLDLSKRRQIDGLSKDRADIILGGSAIFGALCRRLHVSQFVVSGVGLRDGLFFAKLRSQSTPVVEDPLQESVSNLLRWFHLDRERAQRRWEICQQLLHPLIASGKLEEKGERLLYPAAWLCEAGRWISGYNADRHTLYILLHSQLYGLEQEEMLLATLLAGTLQHGNGRSVKPYLALLPEERRHLLRQLQLILRLAEMLVRLDVFPSGVVANPKQECLVIGVGPLLRPLCATMAAPLENPFRKQFGWTLAFDIEENL
ncbi:MAG: Ppx/GppA family phosphatase [Firmicutes bacterium]|nr:Ppx/GppA family phosphatase [Bacillota bacterium]